MNTTTPAPPGAVADRQVVRLKKKGYPTIIRDNRLGAKFSTRIRYRGKVHFITLTEQADTSFSAALEARRRIQSGHWQELKDKIRLRADCTTTLADIETAYRAYQPAPPKILAADTKEKNLNALHNFLRKAQPGSAGASQSVALSALTGELVYTWKQNILAECRELSPEDATRHCRSANSILIQARSVFSDEARTYYERAAKLKLPASLAGFRKEPAFKQVAKTEYHAPTAVILAKTFEHLETITPPNPNPLRLDRGEGQGEVSKSSTHIASRNEYLACWLALGFGLRASEISRATKADFHQLDGDIAFRPAWFGKNKRHTPEIRVQLGAWDKLGPYIEALPRPDSPVLSGQHTERTSDVYRRISGWMKALGWATTHHIHELRAWAGSYIADHAAGDGIRAAQIFLRHASYATTEKYYGHHRKQQIGKVALTIPKVEPPATVTAPALPLNVVSLPH